MITSAAEFLDLRFSEDPSKHQRAAHEDAPLHVWHELVEAYPESRFWVAHNKSVPSEILRLLASDEDARIRAMVAMKRKLDEATQEILARDPDSGVRMSIARNERATERVLRSMLADPWDEIRKVVKDRLQ